MRPPTRFLSFKILAEARPFLDTEPLPKRGSDAIPQPNYEVLRPSGVVIELPPSSRA